MPLVETVLLWTAGAIYCAFVFFLLFQALKLIDWLIHLKRKYVGYKPPEIINYVPYKDYWPEPDPNASFFTQDFKDEIRAKWRDILAYVIAFIFMTIVMRYFGDQITDFLKLLILLPFHL